MKHSIVLFIFLYGISSIAQSTITGTVSDATGEPILGATVLVKGTEKATTTDFDGNYSILASESDVLVFSFAGYKSVEELVAKRTIIDVELISDITTCYFMRFYEPSNLTMTYDINNHLTGIDLLKRLSRLGISAFGSYRTNFKNQNIYNIGVSRIENDINGGALFLSGKYDKKNLNKMNFNSNLIELKIGYQKYTGGLFSNLRPTLNMAYLNYKDRLINVNSLGLGIGMDIFYIDNLSLNITSTIFNKVTQFQAGISYRIYKQSNLFIRYEHLKRYEDWSIGYRLRL